jgi:hypothetical protein
MGDFMKDLTGQKFEMLTAIEYCGKSRWKCLCECGKYCTVRKDHLEDRSIKSCGCLRKRGNGFKHGHNIKGKESRTYHIWEGMKQRCNNPNNTSYYRYGGRGITVCDRWNNKKDGYQNFLKDMGEIQNGKSLDRINNNDNYYKENCKLSTPKEQSRNMHNNHLISYNDKNQCMSAMAEEYKISRSTLESRLNSGKSIEEALTSPVKQYRNKRNGRG